MKKSLFEKVGFKWFCLKENLKKLRQKIFDWLFPTEEDPEEIEVLKEYFKNEKK